MIGVHGVGSRNRWCRPLRAGALWIAQGSGAMHGGGMSGHSSFAVLGGVVIVIGLALLVWAARVRGRRAT